MSIDLNAHPHTRLNILTGEEILVSPHRSKRPWQGQQEDVVQDSRAAYDPSCYLCPGNARVGGEENPNYQGPYLFTNDFSALLSDTPLAAEDSDALFVAKTARGICEVIAFSERHDLTLAEMDVAAIAALVSLWKGEFKRLSALPWIEYIQIFENKGSIMGCSNPHPHGQIWAQSGIPVEIVKESARQRAYYERHQRSLLSDYAAQELERGERVIIDNAHFVVVVPYWAAWPYETLVISKRMVATIQEFTAEEEMALAETLRELTIRYDNIFKTSFPYSAGMHQAPVNAGEQPGWHWHMHFYPPLLRSATVKKFMVGYEMLANPQRDITAEYAASVLQQQSTIHYKHKK